MVEKNKKKLDAKKRRNLWTINPRTRFNGNDKAYNRQRDKKRKERPSRRARGPTKCLTSRERPAYSRTKTGIRWRV